MNRSVAALLAFLSIVLPVGAEERTFAVEGVQVSILLEPSPPALGMESVQQWVQSAVESISDYAGGFPVSEVFIAVRVQGRSGVQNGRAFATDPPVINIQMGHNTTRTQLLHDWVLVHELAHLAVPSLPRAQRWFEEGLAVYVESMARVKAGTKSTSALWRDFLNGFPQGDRQPHEAGLNGTGRWGRIYWGSTALMLRMDVGLRASGKGGMPAVLAAWRQQGWDIRSNVSLPSLLRSADVTLGSSVLTSHYEKFALRPGTATVATILKDLGVSLSGQEVLIDHAAALAAVRSQLDRGPD